MKLTKILGIATLCCLFGCSTTLTPDAQRVMLHSQVSTALTDCMRLGNVVAEAKNTTLDPAMTRLQAINNLRDSAYKQYQADTVVLVNVDFIGNQLYLSKVVAQGIAYKCI